MNDEMRTRVLFVCMGNICRSPTAEGVFRHFVHEAGLAERVEVDSAGTHAYPTSEPADRPIRKTNSREDVLPSTSCPVS